MLNLSEDEQSLVSALAEGPADVDTLGRRAGMNSAQISSVLLGLVMKRVVRMLPGRTVELTVQLEPTEEP